MSAKRRRKKKHKHRPAAGSVPGIIEASPTASQTRLTSIVYSESEFELTEISSLDQLPKPIENKVLWLNVEGYQDIKTIESIGQKFGFHRLVLEDVFYSKIARGDEFPECFLIGFPAVSQDSGELTMLSLLIGENFAITFQKSQESNILDPVVLRAREKMGIIRHHGADYLAYAILDSGVDTFFPVLENWSEELDSIEDDITEENIERVREIRKELSTFGRSIRGLRDVVGSIVRRDPEYIATESLPFYRDCLSHTQEIFEEVERLRELTTEHLNSYDSMLRERNNEAVQTLTVVSTLFIPLSFVAGLYGMNFDPQASPLNMPELRWQYGYVFVLALMFSISVGFLVYFRKKRWI